MVVFVPFARANIVELLQGARGACLSLKNVKIARRNGLTATGLCLLQRLMRQVHGCVFAFRQVASIIRVQPVSAKVAINVVPAHHAHLEAYPMFDLNIFLCPASYTASGSFLLCLLSF